MTQQPPDATARWAAMFDAIAPTYDQSGVPFFGTIADGLVDLLGPAVEERAADLGAGRGAATLRLAAAVGPGGRVDAVDISPAMAGLLRVEAQGLSQVRVEVGDAADPPLDDASYDVVSASLVLFFLEDPVVALRRWRALLVPGGRVGVATFRPWPPLWQAMEDVFRDYGPDDDGPTSMPDVYSSDAGVEGLLRDAGFVDVRTEGATYAVPFRDVDEWRHWSMGTAMRGLWMRVPEEDHPEITTRVAALLAEAGNSLDVAIRYTLGEAP